MISLNGNNFLATVLYTATIFLNSFLKYSCSFSRMSAMCRAHIFCKINANFYNVKCAHIHSYFYQVEYSVVHPQYDHIQSFLPLLWLARCNI